MNRNATPGHSNPAVTVIAAFHKPSPVLAERQIESLLAQTDVRLSLVAVIDGADTAGDGDLMRQLRNAGATIVINETARGAARSFAEGLRRAIARSPGDAGYFAYCDQDDVWHSRKLSRSIAVLGATGAALVHCDARVVAEDGQVIAPSLFRYEARRESGNLLGTLLLNWVTGMTAVFPAHTARAALTVLDRYQGPLLHDHVTSIVAASLGHIAYIDEVLVDYVQHEGNQIGAKPKRGRLRWRVPGRSHVAAYRTTSAEIFETRRAIATVLAREDLLPQQLGIMFLTGATPSVKAFVQAYALEILKLTRSGQYRRARLAARMMDAGLGILRRRRSHAAD